MDVDIYGYHLQVLRESAGVLAATASCIAHPGTGETFWEIAIRTVDNPGVAIGHADPLIALSRAEQWHAQWAREQDAGAQ